MSHDPIAIVGATGQVGSALATAYAGRPLLTPTHAELDFSDGAALAAFVDREHPSILINCTAFHNVDACEREPQAAFAMNALAVDAAAGVCAAIGIPFATFSTDYVFDGTLGRAYRIDDALNPLSAYGASKAAGEFLVRRHGPQHFIFRTSGVFGESGQSNKGYTFIERVLQQAERGEPLRIVKNMTFSPSYAPHVARAIVDLIDANAYGTHHVTNAGATTWYDFASYAFARAGMDPQLESIVYDNYGSVVKRPLYSPLESATTMPPWQGGVDAFLEARARRVTMLPV